jgi:DNA (cytosine-5)-methyltransferase 1
MNAIDLFAGAGGFSTGAQMAGCKVVWAANHWQDAVNTHALNHPDAQHVCQDLHQADWRAVPHHDILLASPACQGHSLARGKEKPHHDAMRSTAWAVVSAIESHLPEFAVVENVPDFMNWKLFSVWCGALHALGYAIAPHLIDSADHGAPQHRNRVYLVISKSKHPLQLNLPKRAHVSASSIIDFESARWSQIDKPGRSVATLARVKSGRSSYGERFIMPYYGSGSGLTGRSLARPIGTITTRDRWAIVDGDRMRMLSVQEARAAMGFPTDYRLPENKRTAMHMLGNAVVPLVARDVIREIARVA